MRVGTRAAVVLFVAAVTATGCAADQPSKRSSSRPAALPGAAKAVTSESDLALPLDGYDLDARERAVVQRARGVLLTACMKRYGLEVALPPQTPVLYPKNAAYIGWLGAKQVSRYGYSGPPGQLGEEAAATNGLRPFPPVAGLQGAVFMGDVKTAGGKRVPSGGCAAAAERVLNQKAFSMDGRSPVPPFVDKRLVGFVDGAAERAYADGRLRAATSAWSSCMRAAGYVYDSPAKAQSDPRWFDRTDEPAGAVERNTAAADERCRSVTNYLGVRKALYADYQQRVIESDGPTVRWLAGLLQARLATAREILSDRSGRTTSRWLRSLDEAT